MVTALILCGMACAGTAVADTSSTADAAVVVTLDQAVQQATQSGPDMKISAANLSLAQAQYRVAAAANGVGVNGSLSGDRSPTTTGYNAQGVAQQRSADTFQGALNLTAPLSTTLSLSAAHTITEETTPHQATQVSAAASTTLWDGYPGGQDLAAARQAQITLQVTQSVESANRKSIIYNVKQAYYTLLGAQQQLAILQQTLNQRQDEMRKTQTLFDSQSASQIDLKQAQVNLTQAQLDLAKAQDTAVTDRESLSALVGWPLEKDYTVAEVADLPVPAVSADDAVKAALAAREDLKQIQLNLQAGAIALDVKRAQASPTVGVSTGIDVTEDWTLSTTDFSVRAGVSVKAPLIDPGSIAGAVQQAALQNEKLRLQQDQLVASITTGVRTAVASLRDLEARVGLAQASLDLAQSQYDLTTLQFASGVSSNLDVLTASVALTTARVNLAAARSAAQLGVLALQNAMGQ